MTSRRPESAPSPPARGLRIASALLIGGFVVAFGARPAIVFSTAAVDDALFMKLGQSLAAGRWLGPYDLLTLTKGPGFPAFLAIANFAGVPYPLSLALFHAACASFAAVVSARLTRSRLTGFAVVAALLLTPTLYNGDMLGVSRGFFYSSLGVGFFAAAIAVATGCFGRPAPMAALAGLLGAWFWLTREEGVWIAPGLAILLLVPLLAPGRPGPGERVRALAPAGLAFAVAAALIAGVGLINWAVYGRFVVNEIKDSAFQSALTALQDASAPFHRRGIPVPAAARARIYAASPAFASIKEPILDGPLQADATQWGCRQNPEFCGDFGGGWFLWDLRSSAALAGWHETPAKAAGFYRRLAREVRRACAEGRLQCRRWPAPLVPPMRASELGDVAVSFRRIFHISTFGEPVGLGHRPSDMADPKAYAMVAFLNAPGVRAESERRRFSGWFVGQGDEWFEVIPGADVTRLEFTRMGSPDLVRHFHDPRLDRQRFVLTVECPPQPRCPAVLTFDSGRAVPVDFAALRTGPHPLGGTLYIDDAGGDAPERLLKTRFSDAWLAAETRLTPVFRALAAAGAAAWLLLLAQAAARRRLSAGLVVSTALVAAVAARMVILALTDALSFSAATHAYALPGIVLLVLFAVLSLSEAARACVPRRREAPAPDEAEARARAA